MSKLMVAERIYLFRPGEEPALEMYGIAYRERDAAEYVAERDQQNVQAWCDAQNAMWRAMVENHERQLARYAWERAALDGVQ